MRSVPYQAIKLRVRPFDFYGGGGGGRKMFLGPVFYPRHNPVLLFACNAKRQ